LQAGFGVVAGVGTGVGAGVGTGVGAGVVGAGVGDGVDLPFLPEALSSSPPFFPETDPPSRLAISLPIFIFLVVVFLSCFMFFEPAMNSFGLSSVAKVLVTMISDGSTDVDVVAATNAAVHKTAAKT
jgi:hypothetical protein